MLEQQMSHKKFWIVRFRDRVDQQCDYVCDLDSGIRHDWWYTSDHKKACHFASSARAGQALRAKVWAGVGFLSKRDYVTEIVEIDETVTKSWTEHEIITNESALIQLARLGKEQDEPEDRSED